MPVFSRYIDKGFAVRIDGFQVSASLFEKCQKGPKIINIHTALGFLEKV